METDDPVEQLDLFRGGVVAMVQGGELEQAAEAQMIVCHLVKETAGEGSVEHASEWGVLGFIYKRLEVFDRAEDCYRYAIDVLRDADTGDSSELALQLNNLGVLCKQDGRLEEASELYEEALELRRLDPTNQFGIANGLSNLGALKEELDDVDEARRLYLEAIDTAKALEAEERAALVTPLNNLSVLYAKTGQYTLAESLLRESVEESEKLMLGDDYRLLMTKLHLSHQLVALGRNDEAVEIMEPTYAAMVATLGPAHPSTLNGAELLAQARRV